MRRIIKAVLIKPHDAPDGQIPQKLEMVPASGSLEAKSEADEQGYVTTYKLGIRVRSLSQDEIKTIRKGCICTVKLDGPGPMADLILGSKQLPIFFTIEDDLGSTYLSATWKNC